MTLNQLMTSGCFLSKCDVAKALGISKQAVSNWVPGRDIPERHYLKMRYEILPKLGLTQNDIQELL